MTQMYPSRAFAKLSGPHRRQILPSLCFNWGTCFMRRGRRVSCNFGGKTITLSWSTKTPSSLYPINVSEKIMCTLRASECFIILSPAYKDIYAIDKFTKDRKITLFWISTKTLGLCVLSEGIWPASSICTTGLYQRKRVLTLSLSLL